MDRNDFEPIEDVPDNLCCGICTLLVIEPLECKSCENLFCSQCIGDWVVKKDECPNRCAGKFFTKQAHRMIRMELSKIKLYCRNRQFGCQVTIMYETIKSHQNVCKFKTTHCVAGCQWQGLEIDLLNHQYACQKVTVIICQKCECDIQKADIQKHDCIKQLKQELKELKQQFLTMSQLQQSQIQELQQNSQIIQQKQESSIIIQQVPQQQNKQSPIQIVQQKFPPYPNIYQSVPLPQQEAQFIPMAGSQKLINNQPFPKSGSLCEPSKLRCSKMHNLQFWLAPGIDASKQICENCLQKTICRYLCVQCKSYFCMKCAPPQFRITNKKPSHCPAGHQINERNSGGYICDVCNRDDSEMMDKRALQCRQCDFDICAECLKKQNPHGEGCLIQ
ncbi:hypothetical protein pb186bvf_017235 [Paramecium bursaria]